MYCQLNYLGECHPGRIRHALGKLPRTLDGTYERTLREINETNWEFARRLLQCDAVVSRPLRVEERAEFLAFDFSAGPIPKFREDWRLEDPPEAVLSTWSTLLSLVDFNNTQVIQFSQFSVKEFLTSARFAEKRNTISHRYRVSLTPAHTLVAQVFYFTWIQTSIETAWRNFLSLDTLRSTGSNMPVLRACRKMLRKRRNSCLT